MRTPVYLIRTMITQLTFLTFISLFYTPNGLRKVSFNFDLIFSKERRSRKSVSNCPALGSSRYKTRLWGLKVSLYFGER